MGQTCFRLSLVFGMHFINASDILHTRIYHCCRAFDTRCTHVLASSAFQLLFGMTDQQHWKLSHSGWMSMECMSTCQGRLRDAMPHCKAINRQYALQLCFPKKQIPECEAQGMRSFGSQMRAFSTKLWNISSLFRDS